MYAEEALTLHFKQSKTPDISTLKKLLLNTEEETTYKLLNQVGISSACTNINCCVHVNKIK